MGNLDLPDHYRRKIHQLIHEYNRPFPGPYYFSRFFKGKKDVKIADIGAGPLCTLGTLWSGLNITIYASDLRAEVYNKLLKAADCDPLVPVEYQDMENLTYPDNFFDLVHCVNAVDHTPNAQKAIDEMIRVCKPGGYIYLRHSHNQRSAHKGKGHFWDAKVNGFVNGTEHIELPRFITTDDGYFIVSIMKKR